MQPEILLLKMTSRKKNMKFIEITQNYFKWDGQKQKIVVEK